MPLRLIFVVFFLLHEATAFLATEKLSLPRKHGRIVTSFTGSRLVSQNGEGLVLQSKTFQEEEFIYNALFQNTLFAELPNDSKTRLVLAFERCQTKKGEKIISQGDSCEGGSVYLMREGKCRVIVDEKEVPEPYGILRPGAIFGELGILYESTRGATVEAATSNATYYQLPGDLFKDVLQQSTESQSWSEMKEIDYVINKVLGTNELYGGSVILPYKPERFWLWKQYTGTVLRISLVTTLFNMLFCILFVVYARSVTGEPLWSIGAGAPDISIPFVKSLSYLGDIWDILKTLTTFILTFFVNQAFGFWKSVYQLSRDVQMSLSDFDLLIATNIKRDEDGVPTAESSEFQNDISHYARLFCILMWASKANRFSCLTEPNGLKRMASRGLMTKKELKVLKSLEVTGDRLFLAPLEWMMIRSNRAMDDGILAGDTATKGRLLGEITNLRRKQASISNKIDGRMPLAYAHMVQILVDTFVFTAPIALYSDLGDYSVFAVGFITLFYNGLNCLAKIFLDPLNNERFQENSIVMDLGVVLRETNVASEDARKSGRMLPFDTP